MSNTGNPPHILVINVFFAPYSYGGATVVAEEVVRELRREHGFQVTAISATSRADMPAYSLLKTEVDGIANYLINMPFGRPYAELYDNSHVTEAIDGLMQTLAPDVVHLHCLQDIGAGVIAAAKRRGLPVVLSTHDFWWLCERQFMIRMDGRYCGQDPVRIEACRGCVDDMRRARSRDGVLKAAASQADLITYPSEFARGLCERSGLSAVDSMVWQNGVRLPTPAFFEAQARRRAKNDRLVFGFVGGPSHIKGWPIIRRAFERIGRDDFAGLLVEGSLDGSWWQDVKLSKLQGDWEVYPRFSQNELDDFYAQIDVLLFLSQWKETYGLTVREALARGIRVIQTDSGGSTEHAAVDPERLLPIGAGADQLIAEIERMLETPKDHPAPQHVTSFADQAKEIAVQMRSLMG